MTADEKIPDSSTAGRPRLRILIADDEPMIRRALRRLFERRGHEVVEADTADAAREVMDHDHLDAALVDVNMPGDGRVVLQALADSPRFSGMAILMTGDLASEVENPPPGTHTLQKPFDFNAVIDLVEGGGTGSHG